MLINKSKIFADAYYNIAFVLLHRDSLLILLVVFGAKLPLQNETKTKQRPETKEHLADKTQTQISENLAKAAQKPRTAAVHLFIINPFTQTNGLTATT